MKKILIVVAVLFLASPFLLKLIPKPLTAERVIEAFRANGLDVTDVVKFEHPMNGAISQMSMNVNGAVIQLYQFDDRGRVATQYEYEKPDAGSVIVEQWNLSEQLGAAKPKNKPCSPAKNGLWLLTATHEDKALRERITTIFGSL